jgi:hypothetical protein
MIWKLWKIQKKIVKRYENMEETQVEMWNDMENMEETQDEKW